jgi:hypothetical protein
VSSYSPDRFVTVFTLSLSLLLFNSCSPFDSHHLSPTFLSQTLLNFCVTNLVIPLYHPPSSCNNQQPTASPPSLGTSPKQFNHFSALSPDMVNSALDADPEMNAILGIVSETRTYDSDDDSSSVATASALRSKPSGPLKVYTRENILRLCRKAVVPADMGPLETWFGTIPNNKAVHLDDPAIAAIGGHGRRGQGGFGEGFGFGGGIGGRGLGRGGTRNIGYVG